MPGLQPVGGWLAVQLGNQSVLLRGSQRLRSRDAQIGQWSGLHACSSHY